MVKQIERVGFELRQDKMLTGCVSVKIRYPDFETTTKQTTIDYTFSDDILIKEAKILFKKLWRKNHPVRLLGVRLSELTNNTFQGNLFDNHNEKEKLYKAIDNIKTRFGKATLQKAVTVKKASGD